MSKADKVKRPEVGPETSEEEWAYFMARWEGYKKSCQLEGEELLNQLKECMEESIRKDHFNQFSGVELKDKETFIEQIRKVAIKKANRAVGREQLARLKWDKGESIWKYVGRIRVLAQVAEYKVQCVCKKMVPYTDLVIKVQGITGLLDQGIKTDMLSHDQVNNWSLEQLVTFVEGKESGKLSAGMLGNSGGSAYVVSQRGWKKGPGEKTQEGKMGLKSCPKCDRKHSKEK